MNMQFVTIGLPVLLNIPPPSRALKFSMNMQFATVGLPESFKMPPPQCSACWKKASTSR